MSKRLRSCMAVVMAAFFALAVMVVPKTAWAEPDAPEGQVTKQTPYGDISYVPQDDGFKLAVDIYVNDVLAQSCDLGRIADLGLLEDYDETYVGDLDFSPKDGFYYYGGEWSYELDTHLDSSWWNQASGNIEFGADEIAQKDWDNVLSIRVYTYSDRAHLNVNKRDYISQGRYNPKNAVQGYLVSYSAFDPIGQDYRQYSHVVTDLDTENSFVNQFIPRNTDVTIKAVCASGLEAQEWYFDDAASALFEYSGSEGKGWSDGDYFDDWSGYVAKGDSVTVKVTGESNEIWVTTNIAMTEDASAPTKDEVRSALGDAAVVVRCENGFASHSQLESELGEDSTFDVGEIRDADGKAFVDVTITPDSYIAAYNATTNGVNHALINPDQDKVITFVHDGSEWVPVEGESPLVLEVTCDAEPTAPTTEQLNELIGDVLVSCTNEEANHFTGHFDLIQDSYIPGTVSKGDDGAYTYNVTINADKYVSAYSDAIRAAHTLSAANNSVDVTLTNNGEGWKVSSGTPVKFEVACVSAPTLDEITEAFGGKLVEVSCLNADAEHAYKNKSYGAIGSGVLIGDVTSAKTVEITVVPGAYSVMYSEDVEIGHWLEPVKQESEKVILFLDGDGKWTAPSGFSPIKVTVKCESEDEVIPPLPRTEEEFKDIFGDGAINVTCSTDSKHGTQKYMPADGYYTYGEVEGDADSGYFVTMTVGPDHYVNLYNGTIGKMHVLAEGQFGEKVIHLVCTDGQTWKVDDGSAPVVYNVVCTDDDPYQPGKPTPGQIEELLADGPVRVDCVSNVGHDDERYRLAEGSYSIADVVGDKISGYTSSITVDADWYIKKYSDETVVEHRLADENANSVTIEFKYVNNTWELADNSNTQVKFDVKCELKAPSFDELKNLFGAASVRVNCTTDPEHYEKSSGLIENSYTMTNPAVGSDGKYSTTVTLLPDAYVNEFNDAYPGIDHELDPEGQNAGIEITLIYDTTNHKWVMPEGAVPVYFKVACEPTETITVTPADITIYQGAENGYEAVIGENGNTVDQTVNALPEPLFNVTLPEGVGAGDVKFHNNQNIWKLVDRGAGYYSFESVAGNDPSEFSTRTATISSRALDFDPSAENDSFKTAEISIYPGENTDSKPTAVANGKTYAVSTGNGVLTIRAVDDEDNPVSGILESESTDAAINEVLETEGAAAVEPKNTTYTLNDTGVELDAEAEPSLLFDGIIDDEGVEGGANRTELLNDEIENRDDIDSDFQSEIKYLDLVDANNGNAWIKSSEGVDIYWDYPDGMDQNDDFKVLHFKNLHRDNSDGGSSGFNPDDIAGTEIEEVTIEKTANGIWFHVAEGNFSPYALVWDYDNGGGNPGGGGGTSTRYYKIEASAGEGGSISPSGTHSYAAGSNVTFTITPDEGWTVGDVKVDGKSLRQLGSYTFEDLDDDHTISVTFMRGNDPLSPDETGVSNWLNASDHVAYLHGYGDGSGKFGPENPMTRAEVAQMFYNLLLDKGMGDRAVSFEDVPEGAYYAEPVRVLASRGILNGTSPETFEPNRAITRAEFVAIAMRFSNGEFDGENPYVDVPEDAWYRDYVVGATSFGWIYGYQDGSHRFGPDDTITRGQATMVTNRMLWRSCDTAWATEHLDELKTFVDLGRGHYAFFDVVEATNAHDYERDGRYEDWTGLRE